MFTGDDFDRSREQVEAAVRIFVTGDATAFQACWSHADDVTIFGAWGAYEQGWEQVGPRLEWAAARFRGGHIDFEPLALAMNGDLAYTIWIERGEVRVIGLDEFRPLALRVTHLYRREDDTWKLIHHRQDRGLGGPATVRCARSPLLAQQERKKDREEGDGCSKQGRDQRGDEIFP